MVGSVGKPSEMEIIRKSFEKNEITSTKLTSEICFKCSACSKFCPVTQSVEQFDMEHSFIVHLFSGKQEDVLKDVWMCSACEKCVEICPQDSDPTDVFTNLKEESYRAGFAPKSVYQLISQLLNSGYSYQLGTAINHNRQKLGLEELVPNEQTLLELQQIANRAKVIREEDRVHE